MFNVVTGLFLLKNIGDVVSIRDESSAVVLRPNLLDILGGRVAMKEVDSGTVKRVSAERVDWIR